MKEREEILEEADRSLAVALMKYSHKLIEDTEKERKRPAIMSVCYRLDKLIATVGSYQTILLDRKSVNIEWQSPAGILIKNAVDIYGSIRFDLKKTIRMKDEDFKKLFPNIDVEEGNSHTMGFTLFTMYSQLEDVKAYCRRLLY